MSDDDFVWKENSKAMYDKVCEAAPWFVRHFTRSGLNKGLKAKGCGEVTEQHMYDVCKEVTPERFLDRTVKILDEHKTTEACLR